MPRLSTCTLCGGKTNLWFGTGNIKVGPCCTRLDEDALFIVGIRSQAELDAWYAKYRPKIPAPTIPKAREALEIECERLCGAS